MRSIKLPLTHDSESGNFQEIEDIREIIKQNIRVLLITNKGDLFYDLEFGTDARKYVFENNLNFDDGELRSEITIQMGRYFPYVVVDNIDFDIRGNNVFGRMFYHVPELNSFENLDFILDSASVIDAE